jgi:hypothetical protein
MNYLLLLNKKKKYQSFVMNRWNTNEESMRQEGASAIEKTSASDILPCPPTIGLLRNNPAPSLQKYFYQIN